MIIAFTGHRASKLGGYLLPNPTYNYVCQQTEKILKEMKPEKCYCGMVQGYDLYAANVCTKLNIPFIAAIPFLGQEKMWPEKSQKTYHSFLLKAESVVIVSEGSYSSYKMQLRNQYMVDNCDLLLACHDGSTGGTANCINYAKSIGRSIFKIDPRQAT